ncbi:MAG: phosphate ABC transporter permease PstA [Armatimonadetes bacterium]|nr:MAG: phosphate ABC transporter permease PstA [Armatimonadota bacterium]
MPNGETTPNETAQLLTAPREWRRAVVERLFLLACLVAVVFGVLALLALLYGVLRDGLHRLDWEFLTSFPSRKAERAGIYSALIGTLWLMGLVTLFTVPIGIASAIYLEEFAPRNRLTSFIQINITNLAGVPSIVYGLLGLAIFVRMLEPITSGQAFGFANTSGRSVLAGSLTMSLLILPMVITACQEALRAVPQSHRQGALALGSTTWEAVRHQVLPAALPGMLTGVILGLSRAIGETAPLITIGALTYVAFIPKSPFDGFTVLPIQIFNWASRPQEAFHANAAAGILVLLVVLALFNSVAIVLRIWARRRLER